MIVIGALAALAGGLLGGCAAESVRGDIEVAPKAEALEGQVCVMDSECGVGEYCDRSACLPEEGPCSQQGSCTAQTHFYLADNSEIPDNDPAGLSRTLEVRHESARVASLSVTVSIDHSYIGDLRVVLRSPSGTEVVLHNRSGGSADDLLLSTAVTGFDGELAHGGWSLRVSDHANQDVGVLRSFGLQFSYIFDGGEPTEGGLNVWAGVDVSVASAHPYLNDTDQSTSLTLYTGGGERARLHFANLQVEDGYDFVEVIDNDTGLILSRFTGDRGSFTSPDYETSNLSVRLVSDYSVTGYGFAIDRVEVFGAGCLLDSECGEGMHCPLVNHCITAPCFQRCEPIEELAGEGEACSTSEDCEESLYCASDSTCRVDGSCSQPFDCEAIGNGWIHPTCTGTPTCSEAGACGWDCLGPAPICAEGDTSDDGCNICTCTGGAWVCTERFCPPIAGEGEACGDEVLCEEGLVCDRGRSEAPICDGSVGGGEGVCVRVEARACTREIAPVCACTGQTFNNDCVRAGLADFASEGRCELSLSIPDASPVGVSHTVHVLRPEGATSVEVEVEIEHTYRGDLVISVIAPDGSEHILSDREGGSADDFAYSGTLDLGASSALGAWTLRVRDLARQDTGVIRFFNAVARPSTLGATCGGFLGVMCDEGQFCNWRIGQSCGWADAAGTCELPPAYCPAVYEPVCGCDSVTYSNECAAHQAGVSALSAGPCAG